MDVKHLTGWATALLVSMLTGVVACTETTPPTVDETSSELASGMVANPAAKVTLSLDTLWLAPSGATATLGARAFDAEGKELQGPRIKWWGNKKGFTFTPDLCTAPCSVTVTSGREGLGKLIIHEYGGIARDTTWVRVGGSPPSGDPPPTDPPPTDPPPTDPPPAPAPEEPPPPPAPAPAPPPGGDLATCPMNGAVDVAGTWSSQYRDDGVAAGTAYDAAAAQWNWRAGTGGAARITGASRLCWHGGRVLGTADPLSTNWSTYHDTYAYQMSGAGFIVEDAYAENVGDGIKWMDGTTNDWVARRIHLKDMHDDCVETDWMRSGTLEDFLFEGCYAFLAIRPNSSVSSSYDNPRGTIVVRNGVAWMKPTATTYDGVPYSTSAVFKTDNGTRTPRVVVENLVLRVDVDPEVGNACLNPNGQVLARNATVVWTGSGDYPCLPLPPGWTLSRDKGVYDRAAADWKARNPGL